MVHVLVGRKAYDASAHHIRHMHFKALNVMLQITLVCFKSHKCTRNCNTIYNSEPHFVVDDHVVLGGHVVSNVVVHYESEQSVEEGEVNLLIELVKPGLHHYVTLSLTHVPHILQVVDA